MNKLLQLLIDNRSGVNLEFVLCIKNDFGPANNFIKMYQNFVDIVLLSDDDLDSINKFIFENQDYKFTLYRRTEPSFLTENYFIEYLNNYSRSNMALFICTDEYIQPNEINVIYSALCSNMIISANRIDYLFHRKIKIYKNIIRGGKKGDFEINNDQHPHKNINIVCNKKHYFTEIHHLSKQTFLSEYTKIINYVKVENDIFKNSRFYLLLILKRYFFQIIRDIIDFRIIFRGGIILYFYNTLINLFCLLTFSIIYIESKINTNENLKKLNSNLY